MQMQLQADPIEVRGHLRDVIQHRVTSRLQPLHCFAPGTRMPCGLAGMEHTIGSRALPFLSDGCRITMPRQAASSDGLWPLAALRPA